jgi:hypothetical protein
MRMHVIRFLPYAVSRCGLTTAGLALAMRSVVVLIVECFFLIGNCGMRIDDCAQSAMRWTRPSNLTRQVSSDGAARPGQLRPHGDLRRCHRSSSFERFPLIPGANFVWHDDTLTLPSGIDHAALTTAVNLALKDSHVQMGPQTQEV